MDKSKVPCFFLAHLVVVLFCVVQAVPVAYEDLPVTLPTNVTWFQGHDKGVSPLSSAHDWLTAKCAKYIVVVVVLVVVICYV